MFVCFCYFYNMLIFHFSAFYFSTESLDDFEGKILPSSSDQTFSCSIDADLGKLRYTVDSEALCDV